MNSLTRRKFSLAAGSTLALALSSKSSMSARSFRPSEDPASLTLAEVAARLRSRSISSVEVVQACLERIERHDHKTNSFITVLKAQALAQARALDTESAANHFRSLLHGVPIALKDNIDTADVRTTAASAVFADRVPSADAQVVRKLKDAGAVIIGKANMGEFCLSGTSAVSHFGPVRNPWALDRVSGGTSGGSAAALAADFCHGALGTDTGGSVRIPAAYCGIVALKPTYGLVSVRGIVPLALSFDCCGPMARRVEDVALLLDVISGYDPRAIGSVRHAAEDYAAFIKQPVSNLRVGIPRKPYFDDLDREVGKSVETALAVIGKLTRGMKEVSLPPAGDLNKIVPEIKAYHHRLQREGHADRYAKVSPNLRRLLSIEHCDPPPAGNCNEELSAYVQWRWDLDLLRRTADEVFDDFDVVVTPTVKFSPPLIADALKFEVEGVGANVHRVVDNTMPFNAYGWPAISLPCGFSSQGLPIGLMIAGPHFSEGKLLALAHAYEQATSWHLHRPEALLG